MLRRVSTAARRLGHAFVSHSGFPYLFSFAMVALTFKQARLNGNPGPAEIVALLLSALVLLAGQPGRPSARGSLRVALGAFAFLCLGTVWALFAAPERLAGREMLAYPYAFLVVCGFLVTAADREEATLRALATVIGLILMGLVLLGVVPSPLQPLMWGFDIHDDLRFRGLSDNPNQMAFLALAGVGLLCLPDSRAGFLARALRGAAAIGCTVAGTWARSRAFTAGVVVFILLVGGMAVVRRRAPPGRRLLAPVPVWLLVLPLLGLAVPDNALRSLSTVERPKRPWLESPFRELFAGIRRDQGLPEAEPPTPGYDAYRYGLWRNALMTVARSPFIGLGMGAHVPPPKEMAAVSLVEAHNTLLDLAVVSGLAGIAPLVILVTAVLKRGGQTGRLPMVLLIGAPTATFAMFHFVGRQPIFWVVLFACAWAAQGQDAGAESVRPALKSRADSDEGRRGPCSGAGGPQGTGS